MKTKQLLSVSFAFIFGSQLFAQTSGGPDAYGYRWRNQADTVIGPGAPSYNWIDISAIGTPIAGLADDNTVGPFNLNWNFHYYWSDYNKIWIGSNGYVAFQTGVNIASAFPAIPTSGGNNNNFVAGFMADFVPITTNGSKVTMWSNNLDSVIVQFDSVPFWAPPNTINGRNDFQIILSGSDSTIKVQFKKQIGTTQNTDIKSGIENVTGQIGLSYLNNVYPLANTCVKYYYPNPVTYQVFDVTPSWNKNTENGGFFVSGPFGSAVTLSSDISNVGNQPVGAFNVTGQVLDLGFTQVLSTGTSVTGLAAGADTIVTFPATFQTNTIGTYTYRTTTALGTDMNSGNDIQNVEMIVVDTTQASISLGYDLGTPSGGLSWQGGGGGGGIYIEPPFYPATINSIDYFLVGLNAGGFYASIVDDDGVSNSPGTTLFRDTIPGAGLILNAYNNVPLATPLTVTSGGVYISWEMNGDSIAIGTEDNSMGPVSNRTYEILGGSWAIYRNRAIEDLNIKINIDGTNTVSTENISDNLFYLSQNYPNPSSSYTAINFNLVKEGNTQLVVRNMVGQELENINLGNQSAGNHVVKLNTGKFASGIYFYSLKVGDKEITKKMIVSR